MRIFIAGGFGFIGGRLAQYLHGIGHHIIIGSRVPRSRPTWLPEAEVVVMQWNDTPSLQSLLANVDIVINAAGMNAQECYADPVAALEFNAVANTRLIYAAVQTGVMRYIYLSTVHVYANPLIGTFREEDCPRNLHPYASSKHAGENALLLAHQTGKIQGLILRISNAFGAPVHRNVNCWMLLINDLCRQIAEHREIILQTSGTQLRDFITLSEVCHVIGQLSLMADWVNLSPIMNVGSGKATSVLAMAELIQARSAMVLGFRPRLQSLAIRDQEKADALDLRVDKLSDTGLRKSCDIHKEMDTLLHFCASEF